MKLANILDNTVNILKGIKAKGATKYNSSGPDEDKSADQKSNGNRASSNNNKRLERAQPRGSGSQKNSGEKKKDI